MNGNHNTAVVIMAGGKGTRMKSEDPKVLVPAAGRPLLAWVLDVARGVDAERTVVIVGHQAEKVKRAFADSGVEFVVQEPQLGTGHAVMQAEEPLNDFDGTVVVLSGDMVLVRTETVRKLLARHRDSGAACTVLTAMMGDPAHYGRIVRNDDGTVWGIVEYRDADEATRAINEVNSGTYAFDAAKLFAALKEVDNDNDQHEYYLTDVVGILRGKSDTVAAVAADDPREVMGVNSQEELTEVEPLLQSK